MPDAARYTEPYLRFYRAVPAAGPGVCRVCHSGPGPREDVCASCLLAMDQVSRPTCAVAPISLYQSSGGLWQVLRDYKDGAPAVRARLGLHLAATLASFTTRHRTCLEGLLGGPPDLVATIPSTRTRPRSGPHPLQAVVTAVTSLAPLQAPLLAPGPAAVGHGQADDAAFLVTGRPGGRRVLLVDDTFTTGARAQSAASAVSLHGARAVAVLTIGRVIWPQWNDNCRRIWDVACQQPFSFGACCLCRRV